MALLATQIQRPPEMEMQTEYPFREHDLHSRRLPAERRGIPKNWSLRAGWPFGKSLSAKTERAARPREARDAPIKAMLPWHGSIERFSNVLVLIGLNNLKV